MCGIKSSYSLMSLTRKICCIYGNCHSVKDKNGSTLKHAQTRCNVIKIYIVGVEKLSTSGNDQKKKKINRVLIAIS